MRHELDRVDQRQLVSVHVPATQLADHVLGLQDAGRPAVTAVIGRADGPQMLAAGHRARAILSGDPEDRLAALRIDAEHVGGQAVRPDYQVAYRQVADGPPAVWR